MPSSAGANSTCTAFLTQPSTSSEALHVRNGQIPHRLSVWARMLLALMRRACRPRCVRSLGRSITRTPSKTLRNSTRRPCSRLQLSASGMTSRVVLRWLSQSVSFGSWCSRSRTSRRIGITTGSPSQRSPSRLRLKLPNLLQSPPCSIRRSFQRSGRASLLFRPVHPRSSPCG